MVLLHVIIKHLADMFVISLLITWTHPQMSRAIRISCELAFGALKPAEVSQHEANFSLTLMACLMSVVGKNGMQNHGSRLGFGFGAHKQAKRSQNEIINYAPDGMKS